MIGTSYYNTSFFVIAGGIVFIHLAVLLWLYPNLDKRSLRPASSSRVVVKTIDLLPKPLKQAAAENIPLPQPKPSLPKPKTSTPAKKIEKPKKSMSKTQETPKKNVSSAHQALLEKAKETVANIKAPVVKSSPSPQDSKPLTDIALNSFKIDTDFSYEADLSSQLKLLLKLPEPGKAVVDLTVDRTGKIKNVQIIEAKSVLNKKYLEKTLPELALPPFGIYFRGMDQKTFRLELRA